MVHVERVVTFCCFQAEDGIRDKLVTGVQTCALPISSQVSRPLQFSMASRTVSAAHSPPVPAGLSREQLLDMYRYLRVTRTLEERLTALYRRSEERRVGKEGRRRRGRHGACGESGDVLLFPSRRRHTR